MDFENNVPFYIFIERNFLLIISKQLNFKTMKQLFLFLCVAFIGVSAQAQEVKWMSMNEATAAQKKNNKPIFIDAYTVWCGPCKMLDKNTFSDPKIAKILNEKYNPVKFNAEGNEAVTFLGKKYTNPGYKESQKNSRNGFHDFAAFIGVKAYPNMIIIGKNGKVTKDILGYQTAEQLAPQL